MKKGNREPHERMAETHNGLRDTQEVLYQDDFNRADAAGKKPNKKDSRQNEK
ncbi:YfhE family protein [Bhargavaea beijingensis]|uniref:YfhE family protein n=1 Tax=Bhargavaea beijingensis TaxID=426756 RepID=A0A1G6Y7C2_9BACL|nr:YfhE family protein [Bhargavaea beijingensis]MCW1927819.1 YfhE family protein [Bhargavaea beijingensis]RSK31934.1 YfhE family protein [Bhargavaea beijingensis]SDD86298.1 YfhE-like protein [Bhargavaea beijingensis]